MHDTIAARSTDARNPSIRVRCRTMNDTPRTTAATRAAALAARHRRLEEAAKMLRAEGYNVVSPIEMMTDAEFETHIVRLDLRDLAAFVHRLAEEVDRLKALVSVGSPS